MRSTTARPAGIAQSMGEAILTTLESGSTPLHWEMMLSAYHHMMKELDPGYKQIPIGVGSEVEPLFGLPVKIVSGAQKVWRLVEEGARVK